MDGSAIFAKLDVRAGGIGGSRRGVLSSFFGGGEVVFDEGARVCKGDGGVNGRLSV